MSSGKILKTVLLSAVAVVVEENKKKCRPSELPIYTPDPTPLPKESITEIPPYIQDNVSLIRQRVTTAYSEVRAYKRVGTDYVTQSKDSLDWIFNYLRKEDNTTPKAGAIAIGGLTGLIFGLRGGFFKRTLYATTGALAMASICYPKEASEYSQIAITESQKYATIAYNFAYGVKKDDPPLELPTLPNLPSSLSEAWDSITKSATSLVSGESTSTKAPQTTTHN